LACLYIVLSDAALPNASAPRDRYYADDYDDRHYRDEESHEERKKRKTAQQQLLQHISSEAAKDVYTVMFSIAMGPEDAESWRCELRGIKGCNFAEVAGPLSTFKESLSRQFAMLVTPIATDFSLELHAAPFEIQDILGWKPAPNMTLHKREGEFMRFTTIFAYPPDECGGGLYALKLQRIDFGDAMDTGKVGKDITLAWVYRDINGKSCRNTTTMKFTKMTPRNESKDVKEYSRKENDDSEYQENDSTLRKMIMAIRFVNFVNNTCKRYCFNSQSFNDFQKYWKREQDVLQMSLGAVVMEEEIKTLVKYVNEHIKSNDSFCVIA